MNLKGWQSSFLRSNAMLKEGIRILAIDDSPFSKKDKEALAVGVLGRKGVIEGVISFCVKVDGSDSTKRIISKVKGSRFCNQIGLIALHGITLAGLNLVDIVELNEKLKIPVVEMTRKTPSRKRLWNAMRTAGLKDLARRKKVLDRIEDNTQPMRSSGFHVQYLKIGRKDLKKHLDDSISLLRLAHIIASGIVKGESKGRL